MKTSDM